MNKNINEKLVNVVLNSSLSYKSPQSSKTLKIRDDVTSLAPLLLLLEKTAKTAVL